MIKFYTYPTPNTRKVGIMLEECALPYEVRVMDITEKKQFAPAFLAITPNNRVPAIVGHEAPGEPRSFFEPVSLRRTARSVRLPWSGCSGRSAASARRWGRPIISFAARPKAAVTASTAT